METNGIARAKAWAKAHEEELVRDLFSIVRVKSVSVRSQEGPPYGEGCAQALKHMLERAASYGFLTENSNDYCGSVLYPGKEKRELAVCAHLDVVPEGDGWRHDPYDPYLKDGWVYGRGAADNKGAAVACLYLLRYLKEQGISFRHTIRVIYGCNEEAGMTDIPYYLSCHEAPDFVLVPDAALPAVYAEKAGINALFSSPVKGNLVSFAAGHSLDSVPVHAACVLSGVSYPEVKARLDGQAYVTVRESAQGVMIAGEGLAAHAAFPERGYSAAVRVARAVLRHRLCNEEAANIFRFIAAFEQTDGTGLDIGFSDEISGKMTVSGCRIETKNGRIFHSFQGRGPVTVPQQTVWDALEQRAVAWGWRAEEKAFKPFNVISPDHPVIQALTRNSVEAHGIPMRPFAMAGGTYARMFPRAVAAGFGLQGQKKPCPAGHGGGHQPDECVSLTNLENGIAIYAETLQDIDALTHY
ncbi:MAG: Sapep family Mn(2+)-dependent dipeptidase [Clostridia bacterium]|nr:Sapep family Mn(2+)-dependent dipeptidase [Clostridia bacterium]